jgi:nucleoside 2-deoxyribosyltransferase
MAKRVYLAGPDLLNRADAVIAVGGRAPATDTDGMAVEPFGLMENLMIVEALRDRIVHRSFDAAVAAAARLLVGD